MPAQIERSLRLAEESEPILGPPDATKDRMVVVGVVAGNRLTPSDLSS